MTGQENSKVKVNILIISKLHRLVTFIRTIFCAKFGWNRYSDSLEEYIVLFITKYYTVHMFIIIICKKCNTNQKNYRYFAQITTNVHEEKWSSLFGQYLILLTHRGFVQSLDNSVYWNYGGGIICQRLTLIKMRENA